MARLVKQGHAVAHVLEGDTEFLLALTEFIQQSGVLHGDHRLCSKVLQESDLLLREWADFLSVNVEDAEKGVVFPKSDTEESVKTADLYECLTHRRAGPVDIVVGNIGDVDHLLASDHALHCRSRPGARWPVLP